MEITEHLSIDPVTAANELIVLGERATDEGRESATYFDHAEAILNAAEVTGDASEQVTAAAAFLTRPTRQAARYAAYRRTGRMPPPLKS